MGDAATLITAITGLVTAVTGLVGATTLLVIKMSKKGRRRSARGVVAGLAEAAEDGVITVDELKHIAEQEEP